MIADERRLSHAYGGRSVFGWEPAPDAFVDKWEQRAVSLEGDKDTGELRAVDSNSYG